MLQGVAPNGARVAPPRRVHYTSPHFAEVNPGCQLSRSGEASNAVNQRRARLRESFRRPVKPPAAKRPDAAHRQPEKSRFAAKTALPRYADR